MKSSLVRALLVALVVLSLSGSAKETAVANPASTLAAAKPENSPQVFLRRLHLVRPDLIPYPISVEIFC
jgi:hypothetical protein